MSESASRPCGCRYIRPESLMWYQVVACPDHDLDVRPWYQVVACPDHDLDVRPQAELPPDAED